MAVTEIAPDLGPSPPRIADSTAGEIEREDRAYGIRGASANFLTLVGQTSMLLFQILGARLFGAASWGAYAFGLSALEICGRLGLMGADKGILVFVAQRRAQSDWEGAERAIATGIRMSLVLGGLLAIGALVGAGTVGRLYGQASFGQALRIMAVAIPMMSLTTILLAATMARKTMSYNLLVKGAVEPVLRISLILALGLSLGSLRGLALVHVIAAAATAAVALWAFTRLYPSARILTAVVRSPFDTGLVRYAVPLAASEFVNSFLAQTNVLVLGKFRSAEEVGVYSAALALSTAVSFLRGAFDTVLAPIAAEALVHGDHARLARNLQLYCRIILVFAVPLAGLMIVGGPVLLGFHGPVFEQGRATLAILSIGHVVNASMGLCNWTLLASGRSRIVLANNVAAFVVNIVLCVALVPRLGMEGAAVAAASTITVLQAIIAFEAFKLARVQPFSAGFVRLAVLGAAVIGGELGLYEILPGAALVRALVSVVGGALAFFLLAWLTGTKDERDMLKGLVGRWRTARAPEAR